MIAFPSEDSLSTNAEDPGGWQSSRGASIWGNMAGPRHRLSGWSLDGVAKQRRIVPAKRAQRARVERLGDRVSSRLIPPMSLEYLVDLAPQDGRGTLRVAAQFQPARAP